MEREISLPRLQADLYHLYLPGGKRLIDCGIPTAKATRAFLDAHVWTGLFSDYRSVDKLWSYRRHPDMP